MSNQLQSHCPLPIHSLPQNTFIHAMPRPLTAPLGPPRRPMQLTVDPARKAHQSPGRLVDEDGLRGLALARRTGQGQSGVVAFLVWELVRLQESLHRRRREDGLNSTHIFPVKSATACTEVTVTGKMSIGPPKDRCGRLLETLPFARERPPFCLRKRNHSRDTTCTSTLFTLYPLHDCMDEYIH